MSTSEPPPAALAGEPAYAGWKVLVGTAAGVFLGVIFVVGLYAKALDPEAFVETIGAEGLDFLLPAGWVAAVALSLEAILGFSLLLGLRRLRILLPSAALVAFFVFLTARAYLRFDPNAPLDEHACGCFGNLIERSPAEAFWQDLLMLVPACALAFLARPRASAPHTRTRFIAAGGLTAALLGFAWLAPDLPIDDMATRLSPGVHVRDLCAGQERPEAAPAVEGAETSADDSAGSAPREGRVCLIDIVPELAEGASVVVLAALDDPRLVAQVAAFSAYALDAVDAPLLFVVTPATEEAIERFRFDHQPAFDLVPGHAAVVRPLYRRLPRSFLVKDGTVTRTWQGWPPLAELAAAAKSAGSGDGGSDDDGEPDDAPDDKPEDKPEDEPEDEPADVPEEDGNPKSGDGKR